MVLKSCQAAGEPLHVQFPEEGIDHSDGVVLSEEVQRLWRQRDLMSSWPSMDLGISISGFDMRMHSTQEPTDDRFSAPRPTAVSADPVRRRDSR
jgi:hypothetical protein